jgi:hypothetical protein
MVQKIIKNYILEHKDGYSRELITKALVGAGYKINDINKVFYNLTKKEISRKNNQSQGLIILKIIIFIFVIITSMFYLISFLGSL